MSFVQTAVLGAIAGFTIFLGLPIGRARNLSMRARVALSMLSAGVLAFLFLDVGAEGLGIVESRLDAFKHDGASLWPVIRLFALLSAGSLAGAGGSARAPRTLKRPRCPLAGGGSMAAMTATEAAEQRRFMGNVQRPALRTAMVVAAAIGLHSFAEGLAIGVSAQAG